MRLSCCESRRRAELGAARAALLLLLIACLPACVGLSVDEERRLGEEIARQARGDLLFIRDAVVTDYVRDIGESLVAAVGPQPFEYRFEVVEDDAINAFTGPAGHVYVHTGTILQAQNVSQLAAVLAHEIGHVALRHVAKNYERRRGATTLHQAGVLAASVFGYGAVANMGGGLAAMAALNSFSRAEEGDADEFAVRVLPAAGYDPNGLLSFLQVVRESEGDQLRDFLSSHPATEDRIARTTELVAARTPTPGLRVTDGGRLEIIQRRIEILTRKVRPAPSGERQPL